MLMRLIRVAVWALSLFCLAGVVANAGEVETGNKPRKFTLGSEVGAIQGRTPEAPASSQTIGAQGGASAGTLRSPSGDGDYGYDPIEQNGSVQRYGSDGNATVGFGVDVSEELSE